MQGGLQNPTPSPNSKPNPNPYPNPYPNPTPNPHSNPNPRPNPNQVQGVLQRYLPLRTQLDLDHRAARCTDAHFSLLLWLRGGGRRRLKPCVIEAAALCD